jgi:hypothetical protein
MNRLLIPTAVAALLVGCARPAIFGPQPDQSIEADYTPAAVASEPTVIVREVQREVPVVYVDTVYLEEKPAPTDTVYVAQEYETYVSVPKPVFVPQPPPQHRPNWAPREQPPRPRDRRRDDGNDGDRPREPEKPRPPEPKHPVKKTLAPVTNGRANLPIPSTPPVEPTPPAYQAPGGMTAVQIQREDPKQVPTLSFNGPAASASGDVQTSLAKPVRK